MSILNVSQKRRDLVSHSGSSQWAQMLSWGKRMLSVSSLIYPSTLVDASFFTSFCQRPLWTNRGRFSRLRPRYLDCWLGSRLQTVEGASQESRFFHGLNPSFAIFLNTNCRLGPFYSLFGHSATTEKRMAYLGKCPPRKKGDFHSGSTLGVTLAFLFYP